MVVVDWYLVLEKAARVSLDLRCFLLEVDLLPKGGRSAGGKILLPSLLEHAKSSRLSLCDYFLRPCSARVRSALPKEWKLGTGEFKPPMLHHAHSAPLVKPADWVDLENKSNVSTCFDRYTRLVNMLILRLTMNNPNYIVGNARAYETNVG